MQTKRDSGHSLGLDAIKIRMQKVASKHLVWICLAFAVVGDIITTLAAQQTFGSRFQELGGIAGTWMRLSPNYWFVFQFTSEFAIFGIATLVFKSSKRVSWGIPMKWWSLATVLTLVGWNIGMITVFKLNLV